MKWMIGILGYLLVTVASAFETIDPAIHFPAVVQGHRGGSNASCNGVKGTGLTQYSPGKITGTQGADLKFCTINPYSPSDGCDNADASRRTCTVDGTPLTGLKVNGGNGFQSGNGSDGGVDYCNTGQQIALGSATAYQYGSLSFYSACTVIFSSARTEYRIQTLNMGNGAKLVLPSGDYWIENLGLQPGAILEVQGSVRLFIKNSTSINTTNLNEGGQGDLLLFGYGDLTFNSDAKMRGYVYTDQTLTLNDSIINGRTSSRSLTMNGTSAINNWVPSPPIPMTCFRDDFSASALSQNWATKVSSGTFTPSVVGGRLRLTQAVANQSTATTYLRLFPGAGNLVTLTFDQYAHSGTGADGMAIVLSDASVAPQPGAFGGPLGYGYKTGIPGFTGGWLGLGLDEYGNFSAEGGSSNVGRRQQSVVVRGSGSGTAGYRYLRGTCSNGTTNTAGACLTPPVSGTSGGKYRLTLDSRETGKAMIKVERDTGSGFQTLFDPFDATKEAGQTAVPAKFLLSLTGSTGGSNNIHEVDNTEICALTSEAFGTVIDHFEFDHSGQALTCQSENITLRACANADCSKQFTDPVTATLSPASLTNGGWSGTGVSNGIVSFSGGSTQLQLSNRTAGAVTMGVSGSSPALKPLSTTLCRAGNGALSAAACTLTFADTGFLFNVPDGPANRPQQVQLKAVKKSDNSQVCVPAFANQSKTLNLKGSYITPNANAFNSKISVNGTSIGMGTAAATPLVLAFDGNGVTNIAVRYPDAGLMQLDATYNGTGAEAGLVMTGTDQFVSFPVGLCVTSAEGSCTAANATCSVFKKTGDGFPLTITAKAWESDPDANICDNPVNTPNFALNDIGLGSELVAPIPGAAATVGTTRYNHVAAVGGLNTIPKQSIGEVGVFRMTATPPAYQGKMLTVIPSAPLGRFVPSEYSLSGGFITPACTPFSYMGQPFASGFAITARNAQQGTTLNYKGEFAKGSVSLVAENGDDGVDRSARIGLAPGLSWVDGVASVNQQAIPLANTRFDRGASVEDPLPSLDFGVKMADNDGGYTLLAGVDMKADGVGTCGSNCNAVRLGTQEMRYGRLLASTRQGVASAPLVLPLQVQYFEGGGWKVNQADVCTQLSLANNGFDPTTSLDPTRKISFNNGSYEVTGQVPETTPPQSFSSTLTLSGLAAPASVATANKGEILLHFSAPAPNMAVRIPYQIVLENQRLQPSAPLWLSDPNSLLGEAIFGSSRGNDRIIYRRELMP